MVGVSVWVGKRGLAVAIDYHAAVLFFNFPPFDLDSLDQTCRRRYFYAYRAYTKCLVSSQKDHCTVSNG